MLTTKRRNLRFGTITFPVNSTEHLQAAHDHKLNDSIAMYITFRIELLTLKMMISQLPVYKESLQQYNKALIAHVEWKICRWSYLGL